MFSFIPAAFFLILGFFLYRHEWQKEPEMRIKGTIMIASYAVIMGLAMLIVSLTNWGDI